MIKKLLFVAVLLCFVATAPAGKVRYDDATGDHQWMNGDNWYVSVGTVKTYGTLPTSVDSAYIYVPAAPPGAKATIEIKAGESAVTGTSTREGFTGDDAALTSLEFYIYGSLVHGDGGGGWQMCQNVPEYLLISGENAIRDTGGLNLRNDPGVIEIKEGGTMELMNSDGTGVMHLIDIWDNGGYLDELAIYDGEVYCDGIEGEGKLVDDHDYTDEDVDITLGCDGVIYITDLDGSQANFALEMKNNGTLRCMAGNPPECCNVIISWDGVGLTTVYCPEPATIALLGLGGLLLRRKR